MFAEGLDVFALGKSLPFSAAVLVRKDLPGQAAGGGSRAGPGCLGFSAVLCPQLPGVRMLPYSRRRAVVQGSRKGPSGEKLIPWSLISRQRVIWSRCPESEIVEVKGWTALWVMSAQSGEIIKDREAWWVRRVECGAVS